MSTRNYHENENENKNEIKVENDILELDQFILRQEDNNNTQELFLQVLKDSIIKYNSLTEEKRREKGIFYMKNYRILLANIDEEVVRNFYNYKNLFDGLMAGKTMFFKEYDANDDNYSNKALSENNEKKEDNFLSSILSDYVRKCEYLTTKGNNPSNFNRQENKRKRLIYNLNHFSFYFNGMYFESIALETFFKLIDDEYYEVNNKSRLISFLPRIIFFEKNSVKVKESNINKKGSNIFRFSEIDCAFVLKEKEKVKIEKEKITCFDKFNIRDDCSFFHEDNFVNLMIEKDNVVMLEVKSNLESFTDNYTKQNILIKFIKKALKFVNYYEELNLIQNSQKIVLIFLYNNSMYYDIMAENYKVQEAYNFIKNNKRIKLYIAYFQPYLKLMNSYERIKQIKEMNTKINEQNRSQKILENEVNYVKERQKILENKIKEKENEKNEEKDHYLKLIQKLETRLELLEEKHNNCELQKNNDKDNNKKEKKNSITSGETLPVTVSEEKNN